MTTILIALVAGLASATMFASIAAGAIVSLLLFYLAPIPLMVVAMGWTPVAGVIGGSMASLGLGLVFGLPYMLAFMLTVALPALWLGHLALLARPAANSDTTGAEPPVLEWYPIGRILVWIAVFASITTICALLTLGTDEAAITNGLRSGLTRLINTGLAGDDSASANRLLDALVALAPSAATVIAMVTLTLNLWLAAKITATSQRLRRPWPDLRATELPRVVLAVLGVAVAVSFAGGLIAIFAKVLSAALLIAYGFVGFAVLHTISQAMAGRSFMLGGLYALTLLIGWPMAGIIAVGISDALFGIRQRYWQKQRRLPTTT